MKSNRIAVRWGALLVLALASLASRPIGAAYPVQWAHQLGTDDDDWTWFEAGRAIDIDGLGHVYFAGQTQGSLGGPNAGGSDVFLGKYDAAERQERRLEWTALPAGPRPWAVAKRPRGLRRGSPATGDADGRRGPSRL